MGRSIQLLEVTPEELMEYIRQGVEQALNIIKKPEIDNDELMTYDEVCAYFRDKKRSTIDNWVKKGKLTRYGMLNSIYFKKSEVVSALVKL